MSTRSFYLNDGGARRFSFARNPKAAPRAPDGHEDKTDVGDFLSPPSAIKKLMVKHATILFCMSFFLI